MSDIVINKVQSILDIVERIIAADLDDLAEFCQCIVAFCRPSDQSNMRQSAGLDSRI